ncbi:MAG TPA: DNA-processing protein DprA [Ignavibacteria bacterium]
MNSEIFKYLFFLTRINNLGNIRIKNILNHFPEPQLIFEISGDKLKIIEGVNDKISRLIINSKKDFRQYEDDYDLLLNKIEKNNIKITTILSDDYPSNLKKIYDAPIILYYKGNLNELDKYSISIVGTRTPTIYGKSVCEKITNGLCEIGIMTVSGMAKGIDSVVHRTTLKNSGITYAILGSGVDVIYPYENKLLYHDIIVQGAVISEYVPGAKPDKVNFPKRNRIVSGIGLGTLIVETGARGGSLITAEFALDQNKEIFAIPGNINSQKSVGANELIKKGAAKLVTCVEDIINEFDYALKPILKNRGKGNEQKVSLELDIFEKKIFDVISYEPIHIDKINEITGLSISDCLVQLLSLEFKNIVKQLPGKYFVRMHD